MYALSCAADAGMGTKTALCQEEGGWSLTKSVWAQLQALIYKGFFGEPGFPHPLFISRFKVNFKSMAYPGR